MLVMGFLRRPSTHRQPKILSRARLAVEPLEDRLALSTLFVVGSGGTVDATHFQTLQGALGVANNADTININPGVAINSVGSTLGQPSGAATVGQTSSPSDSTLIVGNAVTTGEEVQIGAGASAETDLVLRSTSGPGGQFTLTLKVPLAFTHNVGERIDTIGKIGIGAAVTIVGGAGPSGTNVNSPLDVWGVTIGATLENLNFAAGAPIGLLTGSQSTTISNSTLSLLSEVGGGTNNGHNVIEFDKAPLGIVLTGNNSNTPTADQIIDVQGASLSLEHDDGAKLQGNGLGGLSVFDSQNIVISGNTISSNGAFVTLGSTSGTTLPLSATVTNNTFRINGLLLSPSAANGANFRVLLQGNDFQLNTIGITDITDGTANATAAGTIDAGGGALGSLGGNDFHGYSGQAGQFAIALLDPLGTNNSSGAISAHNNLWSVANPNQVVQDSHNNTSSTSAGTVDVGAVQLTPDQQFVQSVYNHFLGRSGQLSELTAWTTQIPIYGTTGVANAINTSQEGVTRTVNGLYQQLLGRQADAGGLSFWVSRFRAGVSLEGVMSGFVGSGEYYARFAAGSSAPNTAYVAALYQNLLNRAGTSGEVAFWVSHLSSLGTVGVASAFLQSGEYRTIFVTGLYSTLLRRPGAPSAGEVAGWVNSAEPLLAIEASFAGSMEFYVNG
jgi:parallel beta-helix repeat protein